MKFNLDLPLPLDNGNAAFPIHSATSPIRALHTLKQITPVHNQNEVNAQNFSVLAHKPQFQNLPLYNTHIQSYFHKPTITEITRKPIQLSI